MIDDAETDRQEALRRYAVLDTPREREFDQLAGLASEICRTPFAAISVIDADRQWFKATDGLSVAEVPRAMSLCAETIQLQDVLVVNDALNDSRFRETFFVTGEPRIRFYAGAPLTTPAGHRLGTICVMDVEPRTLTPQQIAALVALGHQVMSQLELRRLEAEGGTADQELKSLLDVNIAVGQHLDRDELFGAIASSLRKVLETDRFGIEIPIAGNRLQGHILASGGTDARPTQPTVLPVDGTVCHWVMEAGGGLWCRPATSCGSAFR